MTKFKNKSEFENAVKKFVNRIQKKSSIVRLKIKSLTYHKYNESEHLGFTFEVVFDIKDPYVNTSVYRSGHAYIYLSKKFYDDIDRIAKLMFGKKVSWNNVGNTGWISKIEK